MVSRARRGGVDTSSATKKGSRLEVNGALHRLVMFALWVSDKSVTALILCTVNRVEIGPASPVKILCAPVRFE